MVNLDDLKTPKINTWCPGCGNFGILMAFKKALIELGLEREETVLVSGIGCHGKMVNYVNINGFHGIHGRVLPIAQGIKLANPKLKVIGFAGDADQYNEGWGHFAHAIRTNIDMTLIVHDNMVLGLTTGQATSTSQQGFKSKSTPFGVIPPMLNPLTHALVSNGSFVARGFAGDMLHLKGIIMKAISHKGFAFVDVFQPCVSFNYLNTYDWFRERIYKLEEENHDVTDQKGALKKAFEWGDRIPIGIFYNKERPTYHDSLQHVIDVQLTNLPKENVEISESLKEFM
ncbi:2-oxoacid:ferredoxin oxidoreductase subunit beta [Candidatus Bathyarchaeota archaeon]|nr:2-oxoacid:ferredoxin oxidoreductase subunit beta [Candidatus Bathyarchaeota archaeon]